jgi:hypothetical protein
VQPAVETGFDEDGALASFLPTVLDGVPLGWVLVSSLDSGATNPGSSTIGTATSAFASEVDWTAAGLLLPAGRVTELLDAGSLFYGFDEVVVFGDKSAAQLAGAPPVFTTDHEPLPPDTLRAVSEYIQHHSALAIAADGVGVRWFRVL